MPKNPEKPDPEGLDEVYEFGPFRLDVRRRRLRHGDQSIPLSSRAFDTLLALVRNPGQIVEKDEIIKSVWADTFVVDDNLTQQISSLRKTLGDHSEEPVYIQTIPRRGYRFLAEVRKVGHEAAIDPAPGPSCLTSPPRLRDLPIRQRHPRRPVWTAAAIVAALLATATVIIAFARKPALSIPPAIRFVEAAPSGVTLLSGGVISPDGRRLVYVGADSSGQSMLMLRSFDDVESKPLPGTEGASTPFWSPDSQYIAFFGEHALKKIRASGDSPVQTIVASFPARGGGRGGGSWSRSGLIIYAPSRLTELYSVPADGGSPRAITRLDAERRETAHLWPQFLPDGRHFLYTALGHRAEDGRVYLASVDAPERTLLIKAGVRAVYASPGYLLFARDGSVLAQPLDPETGRLADPPRPVASIPNLTDVSISAASDRTLSYSGLISPSRELAWYDRSGHRLGLATSESVVAPALSPDEHRVAGERDGEIWLVELPRRQTSRFMLGPDIVTSPLWSPDGTRLAFASRRAIYVRGAIESARKELLADNIPADPTLYDWSSDGRFILYTIRTPETQWDLWLLPLTGAHTPEPFLKTPFTEYQARISPDGRWIAYVSDESSTLEVYVDAFPSRGHKLRVSSEGGMHPTWRGDGKELFYLTPDKKIVAVGVTTDSSLHITGTHPLFQTRISGIARNHYSVSADGQRFLINSPAADPAVSPINIILNWPALLH